MDPTSNKRAGKAFEYRVRDLLIENGVEAERVLLSGMAKNNKGDIKAKLGDYQFLIECKKSRSDTITLKKDFFRKIADEARAANREAALIHGTLNSSPLVTISLPLFCRLLKAADRRVKCPKCCLPMVLDSADGNGLDGSYTEYHCDACSTKVEIERKVY